MRTKPYGERIAIVLIAALAGCRHTSVQDDPNWPSPGPVDVASLPPIHSVINHGTTDPDALLAEREAANPGHSHTRIAKSSGAAPVVLGPITPKQADEPVNSEAVRTAVQQSIPGTTVSATAHEVPPPVTSAPADLPPSLPGPSVTNALPGNEGVRDSSVTPTQATGEIALPPPAIPQSGSPPTLPESNQSEVRPPASPAERQQIASQNTQRTDISGSPPKEINFEGLPESAVSLGRYAAKVGPEVITGYDLNLSVQEFIRNNVPAGQSIPRSEGLMVAQMVLNQMIDRTLIIQEANRMMKSEKQKEALFALIDQTWKEGEIPQLLKKYKADTPYELDQALKKQGRSLETMRLEHLNDSIAHEFMGMKLGNKIHVSLVEMRRYYNEHRQEFERPAQITWREIRIPIEQGQEAAAREQANAVLKQARQHSDFSSLAKRHSKGPTADLGGLWETTPGSFAVEEVNRALEQLKPGQISDIVATSKAIFVVKVESRREAGPARFDEVQTEIRKNLSEEKLKQAASGYIRDLRKSTVIHTIFDKDPVSQTNPSDNQVRKTSNQPSTPSSQAPAINPVLASPQQDSKGIAPGTPSHTDESGRLPNLNPTGPIPTKGMMSGPQVSPL